MFVGSFRRPLKQFTLVIKSSKLCSKTIIAELRYNCLGCFSSITIHTSFFWWISQVRPTTPLFPTSKASLLVEWVHLKPRTLTLCQIKAVFTYPNHSFINRIIILIFSLIIHQSKIIEMCTRRMIRGYTVSDVGVTHKTCGLHVNLKMRFPLYSALLCC